MITQDEQRETALTLYQMFKEEVYRRRDRMMRWTAGMETMDSIRVLNRWCNDYMHQPIK